MSLPRKQLGNPANIRHSAINRIELVKKRFAPRLKSEQNSSELNTHSTPISCVLTQGRTEGENRSSDNRAAQPKQEIQHSPQHIDCGACLARSGMQIELPQEIPFIDAAPKWLTSRKHKLKEGSIEDYEKNILRLNAFFGSMPLNAIGNLNIAAYQNDRLAGVMPFTRKAGPSRINHETMTLGQIMDRAGLWKKIAECFEPLPIPRKKKGKALTDEEEAYMFEIAESRPKCRIGCCVWTITANTTAHWSEVTNLRLQNLCLEPSPMMPLGYIHIEEGIKNDYRERIIPLNPSARRAVDFLLARAKKFGATKPEHYLIPDRFGNPNKPMSTCKKAWYSVRAKLVERFPHLAKLRQYDLRHHAMTKLLESPEISESTAEEIAGHIPGDMKKLYSHPRMKAKAAAVMVLQRKMAVGA